MQRITTKGFSKYRQLGTLLNVCWSIIEMLQEMKQCIEITQVD